MISRLARLFPAITSTGNGAFWPKTADKFKKQATRSNKFFMATKLQNA
jgi:hypothetical protein